MNAPGDAARYHRLRLILALVDFAVGLAWLGLLLVTGLSRGLADLAASWAAAWWAQVAIVAAAIGLGHALLTAPLAWLGGWRLPRRFGLLHQPLRGWLADRAKAALLGGALGLAAVEVVYGLLRVTPLWWLAAAAVFFVFSVLLAALFPVMVVPLFYRLKPLADPELEARLLTLARRAGVPAVGVWVADQSRKSRTANAAVVGLGRTRRIILFDTLTAEFGPAEIESVLAHELGHHVHGDMRRGLVVQGALSLATFALARVLLDLGVEWWGLAGPADPAGLPWLALVVTLVAALGVPLGNAFSRALERRADDYALALTRDPSAFIAAMERLAGLNLAERRPHRLKEVLFHSHPALDRRIARARGEAA